MIVEIVYMPIVQSDVIKGFLSLNNALLGKGENYQYRLDAAGVIRKQFYAWHAPGQYLLPYILGKPFQNIGYGIIMSQFLALLAGNICYIKLLRKFDIPDVVIGLSMLLLFLQRFFHGVLLVYKTSDVWLFFLVPALLLVLVSYHREQRAVIAFFKYLPVVILIHAFGLFVKHSYAVFAIFATVFLFFNEMQWRPGCNGPRLRKLFHHALPGGIFGMLLLLFYVGFYSRGATPLATEGRVADPGLANILLYPLITVLNAPFGFNGLLYRLPFLSVNDLAGMFSVKALFVGAIMICPVLVVLYKVWRDVQFPNAWKRLAFSIAAFYVAMWMCFVYSGADISNEDRLIFPVVMIIMPVMVHAVLSMKTAARIIAMYFIVSIVFSGAALYSLKGQYDLASSVNRADIFNHFLVNDNTRDGRDLAGVHEVLAGTQRDVLLVVKTPEEFFRVGVALSALASEYDHYGKIEAIIRKNGHFLRSEGFRKVYFIVPAKCAMKTTKRIHFIQTKMRAYKLLCVDL